MTRTLSLVSLRTLVVGFALTLGGCPVQLEDYSDDYDRWWEDCPDGAPHTDHVDRPPHTAPDGGHPDRTDPDAGSTEPECERNADCGEGSCQSGICIDVPPTECTYHSDCPIGFTCDAGLCEPSSVCNDDNDCGDDQACDDRQTCVGPEPIGCQRDDDCGEQAQCVFGACQSIDDDVCQFNHDCGPGRACVDRACTPLCEGHGDCPTGTRCADGVCLHRPAGECLLSSECDGGHCLNGHCVDGCEADSDCEGGLEVCGDDGLCRPDTAPRPFCVEDEECATGHVCVGGVCRTPCPDGTDEECQRFDSQLPICADNGLCYSMAETDPECAQNADCADGQRCLDAMCRN